MHDAYHRDRSALILTDLQPDFMPGGALPVEGGDELVGPIRSLVERDPASVYIATQDWHPAGHVSFASQHPGRKPGDVIQLYGHEQRLWPDHCVQGTTGAELHRGMDWRPVSAIVRKGFDVASDSYSAFRNNWDPNGERPATGMEGYLRERGIDTVILCGLARDFCVKWSAEDAADAGFRTVVLWDLALPVDPDSDERVRRDLTEAGVEIWSAEDLSS